jgi:hypothetical protein
MYKDHPDINTPEISLEIWRYMELWKFLDIIDNKRLFLSQVSQFEDKLDGRIPSSKIREASLDHPLVKIDNFAERILKKSHYINCWSSEDDETYPLWKIYSDYRNSVAIKTTIGDLIKSFSEEESEQYIGKIKYINPADTYFFHGNTNQFFFEKRKYFSFENEVRIMTIRRYNGYKELLELPIGTFVKINPDQLIKEVKLAPFATESFKKLIELKLTEVNINVEVKYSEI